MDSSRPPLNSAFGFLQKPSLTLISGLVTLQGVLCSPTFASLEQPLTSDLAPTSIGGIPEPTTALLGIFGLCLIVFRRGRN